MPSQSQKKGALIGGSIGSFANSAASLSRSPLGIIALFLVLVYGLAAQVTAFSGSFSPGERLPLIYFLVFFPVLVLVVFAWLVSKHSSEIYSPSDFKNEDNYVRMRLATAMQPQGSLGASERSTAAATQAQAASQQQDFDQTRIRAGAFEGVAAQPDPDDTTNQALASGRRGTSSVQPGARNPQPDQGARRSRRGSPRGAAKPRSTNPR